MAMAIPKCWTAFQSVGPCGTVPKCWTVWGSRRDSWVTWIEEERKNGRRQHREVIRDIFGYQIKERTKVFTNVWLEGDTYYEKRSVQKVDYPHGIQRQHEACLHMIKEEYNCELQQVVSVRAALHFVHLWKRNARMKLMKRVRLIFWTRPLLPPAVIQKIYAFVRPVATALSDSSASSSTSEDCEHEDVTDAEIEDYCTEPNTNSHPHQPYVYIPGEQLARCTYCLRHLEHVPNPNILEHLPQAFGA